MVCPSDLSYSPLEPPATPIMLYIGAGYDFSPLLTFSPQGPRYPIAPLDGNTNFRYPVKEPYTSFIFADAKPRHTYAFMVSDFEEWKDVDSRIKNVLYYSQGLLTRWRCVPGADDLIWFEGGGDEAHARKRSSDPAWRCMPSTTRRYARLFPRKRAIKTQHYPLTTVYYLFNTLDIEITRSPRMEKMWSNVQALYVHGLMIHPSTGRGLALSHSAIPHSYPNAPLGAIDTGDTDLGSNLKRVYVLVGSWSGKAGVRHVDFIKKARARLCMREDTIEDTTINTLDISLMNNPTLQLHFPKFPSLTTTEHDRSFHLIPPFVPTNLSLPSLPSFTASNSLPLSSSEDITPTIELRSDSNNDKPARPSLDSLSSCITTISSFSSESTSPTHSTLDFHIPIPQTAWSDKLNNGKGGYYISRTVQDCRRLVEQHRRSEKGASPKSNVRTLTVLSDKKLALRRLWNLKLFGTRSVIELDGCVHKPMPSSPSPPVRHRPPKLLLGGLPARITAINSTQNAQSAVSIAQNRSHTSFEYYHEDFSPSQTVFSPTPTLFVPPA